MDTQLKKYILARDLTNHTNGLFNDQAVDWLIRNRHHNGLKPYFRKVNGKLFINFEEFENWFENQSA